MKTIALLLALGVMASALQVVQTQHAARKTFVELEQLKKTQDQLDEAWRQLQLEQSTWALDDRIESIAQERLGLRKPDNNSLMFLVP